MAVYLTALQPGDTVLGLDLAHGGHLTHGMKLNISGKLYNFISYGVTRDTHRIDFDQVAALAREHKPKLIVAGAQRLSARDSARASSPRSRSEVGAKLFVDMAHYAGLVAAGLARQPGAGGRLRDHDDAQDAARPARRARSCARRSTPRTIDRSVFPGHSGRAADARHRRQGGLLWRSPAARVQAVRAAGHRQRQGPGGDAAGRRAEAGQRRHRQPPDAGRRDAAGHRRQEGRSRRSDRCGITVNKNMIPFDERKPMDPAGSASARRP